MSPALRLRRPTEFQEGISLMTWRDWRLPQEPRLRYLFHIPNGEERPSQVVISRTTGQPRRVSRVGQKLQAMGLTPGVPDYCLAYPQPAVPGLWIELKRAGLTAKQAWAACSAEERVWLLWLRMAGYRAEVCSGWVEAATVICQYLECQHLEP